MLKQDNFISSLLHISGQLKYGCGYIRDKSEKARNTEKNKELHNSYIIISLSIIA